MLVSQYVSLCYIHTSLRQNKASPELGEHLFNGAASQGPGLMEIAALQLHVFCKGHTHHDFLEQSATSKVGQVGLWL